MYSELDSQCEESSSDAFGVEGAGVKALTQPFEGRAVFRMLGTGGDCEPALVAGQGAAVPGRAGSAAIGAAGLAVRRSSNGQ